MRYSIAPVAFAALATAFPQGVNEEIKPTTSAPAGCSGDYTGTFQIQVVNVTAPAKQKRQSEGSGPLILTLKGGILKDAQDRTGYIADNHQFQFDKPAQNGAIYTAGWSICPNNTLTLGGDVVFQQCLSGTFYNLYDEADSPQCSPVYIEAINGGGAATGVASVLPDGQPTASPQPVNQINDGQPQASTGAVQQIGDGQIQAPTGSPMQELPDGQVQAPVATPTPTGNAVGQIGDGQVQAPTSTPTAKPVSPVPSAPVNSTTTSPSITPYTGSGSTLHASLVSFVAAMGAAVFFL